MEGSGYRAGPAMKTSPGYLHGDWLSFGPSTCDHIRTHHPGYLHNGEKWLLCARAGPLYDNTTEVPTGGGLLMCDSLHDAIL
jgi:hypothetical protein